ncbi:TonB-dependent receptor [Flavobacterium humi]|uniref:TonB-dependent receptor n=1 Tax=Flavobacterium humi TaxID=2562683 RepID=A0A4Z0L3E7_9FLAO|nr:TonB-dependent receptor [Flavobacterium humi]TGD56960.1 TonB-dependent receptor [Flavobacterium humi]
MRKLIFTLFFLFVAQLLFSQDTNDRISIEYNNASRKSVLEKIETLSGYTFYFDEKWLEAENSLVSGNYKDEKIKNILEDVFNNTNLNFFFDKNKIILTRNSIIYDKLPDNYFRNQQNPATTAASPKPVFFQQYDSIKNPAGKENSAITLVGRETVHPDTDLYTLSGYVKNVKTGELLPDVTIRVKNSNSNTSSNAEGYYILQLPAGINIIETESLNHKKTSRKIMVYSNGKLDLAISEKINQLDEVVVKGKKNKTVRTAITGVTTIEAEGIKNVPLVLGERDVLKIALTIPGIKTAGEGSAGFNVRGGKEDQNLILLDNATIYNPAHFFGFFSAINPYTTNKVDIYKGSIPAEFGGRLSSVFDITSKNGNMQQFAGEGGIGPVTSNLAVSTPIVKDKSSLLVGGRATYSGWILKNLEDEKLKKSEASFYDAFAKYNHNINLNNSIETTLYYSRDAYSITSDSLYKYSNRLVSLKWKHTFNQKNRAELNFTNSEYKFAIDYDSENLNAFDFGYKINETQAVLKFSYLFNEKHKFTYGLSSKLYGINPGTLDPKKDESLLVPVNIDKEKGLESAVFISDNFKVTPKLLVDVGARFSMFTALGASTQRIYQQGLPLSDATVVEEKKFGNNKAIKTYNGFEPRFALRYLITDDFSVKAGYDKTFQYIHLLSSNTTQSPTDTWKLSDWNVKPQNGQQVSLGLFKTIDYEDLELSLEGYYKKSHNILDYKVGAELLLNENIETELLQGEGKSYGVEFLIRKSAGRLNGWLGYTYSRSFVKLDSQFNEEKVNNGKYFAANFDKPHDVSAVLNYRFTKRYSFSANFVYQTGRPITYPIGKYMYGGIEYTLYSDRNKFRIPDYYRLDVGINIEGNHKIKKLAHSFWNISVYNLLGRNNPYSVYFVTEEGKVKAYKTSIFGIPVPTITYNFKF